MTSLLDELPCTCCIATKAELLAVKPTVGLTDLQVLHEVKTLTKGVTGVPFFIIDGKHSLSGAQESETFVKMFEKL